MSLLSRFFGKPSAPAAAPVADEPMPAPAPAPLRPDPMDLARADEERLAAALAGGAPEALTDCVLKAHSTKARQRAAQAVSDPDHLRELIRLTRGGKDNSVYRILTTKRDALLAADRARDARHTAVDALVSRLARRSRLPYDPLYEPSLALFRQDWAVLAPEASPAASAQVAEHLATMHAVIERHHQVIAAAAEMRARGGRSGSEPRASPGTRASARPRRRADPNPSACADTRVNHTRAPS